ALRLRRVIETPEPQIDRRDHLPAASVVGIALEMRLHLCDQSVDRLIAAGGSKTRGERLIRQQRGPEREIKSCGADGQQHKRHDRDRTAPPSRPRHIAPPPPLRIPRPPAPPPPP